jgi:LCP family protein required for cell wall assembly
MTEPLLPGYSPKKPPPTGDSESPPKPKRFWWRFLLAGLIIVTVSAAATATGVLLYVNSIAEAIGHNDRLHNKLQSALAQNDPGEPQTILILGSDKRAGAEFEEDPGRSDTTMLLRIDPDQGRFAVMSIPRDLEVEIPEVGTEKFNAAYSYGGPKLTLQVVKELTGLKINHVVNIDFLGFVQAVYAIGCVYTDVDRRYYHSNEGLPASEQYAEINIQPGYQLLCGKKALQYVRYRHTDTDIVRSARQQSFISDARHQVSLEDLLFPGGQNNLVQIFTEYTNSDINQGSELLELMKLAVAARSASIDQIHFPAELGPSYVYANETAIHEAVEEFLGEGEGGGGEFPEEKKKTKGSKKKGKQSGSKSKAGKSKKKQKEEKPIVESKPPGSDGLVPAREAGEAEAKVVARKVGGGFPVFYPTRLPSGASYVESNPYERIQDPRVYHLRDGNINGDGERHPAYRMVGEYQPEYEVNYFGIQGIGGWEDPPILDNPSETRTIHGREYEIFVDGENVKLVAWHRGENTYWVSNSLQQSLTNDQMLGIARSAHVILPKRKHKAKNEGKRG